MDISELPGPIYIAGPMTGYPEYNFPAFREAKAWLERAVPGILVESPHENGGNEPGSKEYSYYFRRGLAQLLCCKSAVFLTGWGLSPGATAEYIVATRMGIPRAYMIQSPQGGYSLVRLTVDAAPSISYCIRGLSE